MVTFTAVSATVLWCSSIQMLLLDEPWPKEILYLHITTLRAQALEYAGDTRPDNPTEQVVGPT